MNVICRRSLRQLMREHPEAAPILERWWAAARAARWLNLDQCRGTFPSVDQVGRCLIFNVMGGNFRLIVVASWRSQRLYVKALLTHREYERNVWHKWAF